AFRRLQKSAEIIAFEPQQSHLETLRQSILIQPAGSIRISLVQAFVGNEVRPGFATLDTVQWASVAPGNRHNTLIKIDVEGAELDVVKGASSWMNSTNKFLIEVHEEWLLEAITHLFDETGLRLIRVDQRPLPLLGREMRSEQNWWLVSDLGR